MALFLSLHSFANEALSEIDVLRAQLANEKSKNSPIYIKTRQKLDKLINKNKIDYSEFARLQDAQRLINEQKYNSAIYELNELIELGYEVSKCYELLGDVSFKSLAPSRQVAQQYKLSLQNDKDNLSAAYKLSKLYFKEKKNILALEYLNKVIEKTNDCELLEEIKNIISNKITPQSKYEANELYEALGNVNVKLGEKDQSYDAFLKALSINPKDIYLKYYLSSLFFEDNQNNGAISLFNSILNENPKDYQIKSARAKLLAKNGDIEKAYQEYLEILEKYPTSAQAKYGIFKIYQNSLNPSEILKKIHYKKTNYNPTIADVANFSKFLARMEDEQGRLDFELFAKQLEQVEIEKQNKQKLALLEKKQKEEENKTQNNKKAKTQKNLQNKPVKQSQVKKEDKNKDIKKEQIQKENKLKEKQENEKLLKQKQEKQRLNEEQKKAEIEKKAIEKERKIAKEKNAKKYNELNEVAKKYLAITPLTSQNLIAAANTFKQMGEPTNALKYYKEAMKLDPTNSDIYYNIGLTNFELNNPLEAKINLTKAINLNNENLKAKNLLAFVNQKLVTQIINKSFDLYEKKDYISSFEVLEKGMKDFPDNSQLYYYRALVFGAMNRNAAAIIDLQKAIELDASQYMAYYQLGKLYEKINDERSALVAYERFLSIEPEEKELIDEIQKKVLVLGAKYY